METHIKNGNLIQTAGIEGNTISGKEMYLSSIDMSDRLFPEKDPLELAIEMKELKRDNLPDNALIVSFDMSNKPTLNTEHVTFIVDESLINEEPDDLLSSVIEEEQEFINSNTDSSATDASSQPRSSDVDSGNELACSICDQTFKRTFELNVHMRSHTGERPFVCDYCQKSFTRASYLNAHVRTHTGQKPYVCERCQKSFSRSGHLNRHMRMHTGQRPYACEYCDKSFSESSTLLKHIRTHTGEKPFVCKLCSKSFSAHSNLNRHVLLHNRPCKKSSLSSLSDFNVQNVRTDTGQKPYICGHCKKSFSQVDNLNRHLFVIHNGDKLYLCVYCDESFSQLSHLNTHMDSHSSENLLQ